MSAADKYAHLTREQILARIEAAQEIKRRKKETRPGYSPNEMQAAVHHCDKEIIVNLSGNGSGKTAGLVHEAWWGAEGYHPYLKRFFKLPAKVTVVLDHPDKVADKWLPEMRRWFPLTEDMLHKGGKPYFTSITPPGISEISFMFFEQPETAFESVEGEVFIFDEPPPRHIFNALIRGGRERGTKIRVIIGGTPLGQGWIRREILVPWQKGDLPEVECFRFDSDVNKDNVNWEAQLKYFNRLTEKERATRRHGHFFDLEGLALASQFDRAKHVVKSVEWETQWPCVMSIDPHPSKKHHAIILGATSHDELYVLRETREKMVPREYARHLAKWCEGLRLIDIVVDSLGSSDGTGGEGFRSFIWVLNDEWKKMGLPLRCRATSYNEKNDEDFVTRIQAALEVPGEDDNFGNRVPKLRFLAKCIGSISDVENAEWQRDKKNDQNKPTLAIGNKDFLSCLKYALATGLFYKKGELTSIQRPIPAAYGATLVKEKPLSAKEWMKD